MNYAGKFTRMMKHSCYIYKHATAMNPLTNTVSETWTVSTDPIACLIQPLTGEQAIAEQGLELMADYKGFFLSSASIDVRDKVIFDGKTFLVVYVFEGWSGETTHKEVSLKIEVATSGI